LTSYKLREIERPWYAPVILRSGAAYIAGPILLARAELIACKDARLLKAFP
jgi:hypothetical protein